VAANTPEKLLGAAGSAVRCFVYLMLIMPAAIVVATSFTAGDVLKFPPSGFSSRWYVAAYNNQAFRDSLLLSLRLAGVATVCSLVIGFCAAFALDRYEFRGREGFRGLLLSPLVIPAVVMGLGLLQFLVWTKLNQTFFGLLIGHVIVTLPYVVRTLTAGMILFDRNLEQAAMSLRASPTRVLWTITLPLLTPTILSAVVFAFVSSFGNVTLSIFLGFGEYITLPVQIFSYVENNYDPLIAAVSSVVIFITVITILLVERISGAGIAR
jgi:putative spermidine/putrescine transport system permease protein